MSKPDCRFVELALHKFIRNGYVKRVEEIDSLVDSQMTDCCRTWATYPVELKNYCESKGSIRGYDGLVSADFIPVDIDKPDPSKVTAIVEVLKEFEIHPKNLAFYFSGRGFHIEIPTELISIIPIPVSEFYTRTKRFISSIGFESTSISCDMSMYNTHQLYRLSNTINSKSGLYKIPIRYSEINDNLQVLAKEPRYEEFADFDVDTNEYMNTLWIETYSDTITKEQAQENLYKTSFAIDTSSYKKTETIHPYSGVNSGSRNKTASTYTRKLIMEGCSTDVAMGILYEWNKTNYPPLEINELQRTFESNLKYADTFELSKTKNFRANLRNDIVFQEYLMKADKEPLAIYNYLILNLNDEDKSLELNWGEKIVIKRNQIMISNRSIATKLNILTKSGNVNEQKVRLVVDDLICKKRFNKHIIGDEPKKKRTILTWIHFDFTQ